MITFSRSLNSVKVDFGGDEYYVPPDAVISVKGNTIKLFVAGLDWTSTFGPTEVNGRPSDDPLAVAEFLRDTYFYGTSGSTGSVTIDAGSLAALESITVQNGSGGSAVNIQDGGNSITVDAPVGTPLNVQIGDGTETADVVSLSGSDALAVAIVDGSGSQITSFGGGTQYTEGDVDATITGTATLMENSNTLVPLQGSIADGLLVNLGANNDVTVTNTVSIQDGGNTITVDGTVNAAQSGTWNITNISGTVSLPTGAATETTLSTLNGKIPANLTVSSTRLLVDGSGVTQPVSGTITANLAAGNNNIGDVDIASIAAGDNNIGNVDIVTMPNVVIGSGTVTTVSTVTSLTQMNGQAIAMGTGTRSAGTQRVTIATDDIVPASQSGTWTVQPGNTANTTPWLVRSTAATPAQTSPSVTNVSTSILASNSNRRGATIYNEGSAICYMKLGATASTTSYSCQIASGGYYEVPFGYTGAIDGITSAGTAQLRVTELT